VSALPYADHAFDVAVCTQVYEYVADMPHALRELRRVLKPRGRALIVDTDWESCVWHSSDDARMRRVIECWDTHCPHPHLPRALGRLLREADLLVTRARIVPLMNASFDANTYSAGLIDVIARYAAKRLGESEVQAWAQDLRELGARGEYFFSLNRYLFLADNRSE
jgi:SAM-dependent methyltransferase